MVEKYLPEKLLYIDGQARETRSSIKSKISELKPYILSVSNRYDIDSNLLTAILIDEKLRLSVDDLIDPFQKYLDLNLTVGLAQIRATTAKEIIYQGYYHPNPEDSKLKKPIKNKDLYPYLTQRDKAVYFAAAIIKSIMDKKLLDSPTDNLEIAFYYSHGMNASFDHKKVYIRQKQIINEFYNFSIALLE